MNTGCVIDILFSLLSFSVFGKEIPKTIKSKMKEECLPSLYELSKKHDLANLVYSALVDNGIEFKGNEVFNKFYSEQIGAFLRDETQSFECGRISELFEENGIDFVLLKGSVIRRYYPEPWMRSKSDIDILIKKESIDKARELLVGKLGYVSGPPSTHDVPFYSQSKMLFELHFDLNESDFRVIDSLTTPWEYARLAEGKRHEYLLNEDYFIFYHIVHMAKHFTIGGCGIKPFLDLYLFDKTLGYDKTAVASLCKECELDKFFSEMLRLSEAWFGGAEHTEITLLLQEYLLSGGVFGNRSNRIAVARTKSGGKNKFIFSRIFLSLEQLRKNYRNSKITVWNYPYYTVRRWFNLFSKDKFARVADELNTLDAISEEETANVDKILRGLGI